MDAYIVAAKRSAVGKAPKGTLRYTRADDLAVQIIDGLLASVTGFDPLLVDDVIVGCANPEGEQGLQIGRQIALRALGKEVPGLVINRYCASGLEAISIAAAKIASGQAECIIAGGTESMSQIPMTGYKLAPSYQVAAKMPDYVISMGLTAEAVAQKYDIGREASDAFALRSHQMAAAAQDAGAFDQQIVSVSIEEVSIVDGERVARTIQFDKDECIRRDTSEAALSKLRPVFANKGRVTAGTSSPTSDGAAFVLVASEAFMKQHQLTPTAKFLGSAVAGVDPVYMGIGPCRAIPKVLKQTGLSLNDIGLIELNEAFGVQALAVIQQAGLDSSIVNVNGGAIALGHPLGCTGAKLTIQLIDEMHNRDTRYGMVTACVGGGQGIAGLFEKMDG